MVLIEEELWKNINSTYNKWQFFLIIISTNSQLIRYLYIGHLNKHDENSRVVLFFHIILAVLFFYVSGSDFAAGTYLLSKYKKGIRLRYIDAK